MTVPLRDDLQRRERAYDLRQQIAGLMRELMASGSDDALKELIPLQEQLHAAQRVSNPSSAISETVVNLQGKASSQRPAGATRGELMAQGDGTRSTETTGLEVRVRLQMAYLPSAYYHLLQADMNPLLQCEVTTTSPQWRRLRIISYIEGYTAQAVSTVELNKDRSQVVNHLPTLFPDKISQVCELTRATLNVLAEDLQSRQVEIHITQPVWLLARNSAPLALHNASTNQVDYKISRYLGAFVTPHQQDVVAFLTKAVQCHPDKKLCGYQDGNPSIQVKAIYEALSQAGIRYVTSVLDFSDEQGPSTQYVRLPRQVLDQKQANCLDAVLLFASLLEAITLRPAIVLVPGHALLGWQRTADPDQADNWQYLETTYPGSHSFEEALKLGNSLASYYEPRQKEAQTSQHASHELWFLRWSMRQLRTEYGITPME